MTISSILKKLYFYIFTEIPTTDLPHKENSQDPRTSAPVQLHELLLLDARFFDSPQEIIENTILGLNPKLNMSDFYPKFYDSNPKTIKLLELLVAKIQPLTVVETGIANGISTRAFLNAFQENSLSNSILYSFDIDSHVVVHEFTKNRQFSFKHISEQNTFDSQLNALPSIDLFYHDSDHSYGNQIKEYRLAWPKISRGGALVSDDINWSNAFLDFCTEVNRKPLILSDTEKFCGLIWK